MGFTERYKVFGFECCGECSTMIPRPFGLGIFLWWAVQDLHTVRPAVPVVVPPSSAGKRAIKKQFCRSRTARFAIRGKSALAELGCTTCSLQTVLPDLDPKRPVFMRFFGLSSLSKPIGKPTKSRNFWCSLTQPECSIHNAA